MFDAHPPFQIDGNFGGAAGIADMLMQSRLIAGRDESHISSITSEIELLPALPKAWPTGSVKGLRARGGFEVDVAWRDGNIAEAAIRSIEGGSARLRYGSVTRDITFSKGEAHRWNGR
jgi:alpha-L-fucosidase 2